MRRGYTRFGIVAVLLTAPLLLTGCAASSEQTTEIQHIRTTSDHAVAVAERALSVAQAADQKATQAESLAESANGKVDRMFQRNLRK
jgi:uncharacterized lipoprotein YajG